MKFQTDDGYVERLVVLTMGSFDPVHSDHVALFQHIQTLFPDHELVVGVNSDSFYRVYRGEDPLFDQEHRLRMIRSLGINATLNHGSGYDLVNRVRPDVIAVGSDWIHKGYLEQIEMDEEDLINMDIKLIFFPRGQVISGQQLRRAFKNA